MDAPRAVAVKADAAMTEVPDLTSLALEARAGDDTALDRLYRAARPPLLRWALAMGAGPDAAPDLVQETLWAAHRNLPRFDPDRGTFEGWVATILVRRLRNRGRARARRLRLLESFRREPSPGAGVRSVPRAVEAVDARSTLRRLLEGLTERQREVVAMYDIAEMTATDVARVLDLTPAGVRSIARDAHRKLERAARGEDPKEDAT